MPQLRPPTTRATQSIDVAAARLALDEDHFDLDKIKRRILEFLAVRKLNPDGKGPNKPTSGLRSELS